MVDYTDRYYNHYTKETSVEAPAFLPDRNYMMRFHAPMKSYHYANNNLVIIYFRNGNGSIEWRNKRQVVNDESFIVTNPSEGWEYLNERQLDIDVLSIVITPKLKKEFDTYYSQSSHKLLDNPYCITDEDYFFIEKSLTAYHYNSGQRLRDIYNISLGNQFEFLDAEELTITMLESLRSDQNKANHFANYIDVKKQSTKLETLKRLLIAREYIHDNLHRKVSLDELSGAACLSKFHLYNSFRRVFRKTPHQYTNKVKLLKAKEYLVTKQYSVSEITYMTGFNDIYSFSKLFKKKYGVPPTGFIKNL